MKIYILITIFVIIFYFVFNIIVSASDIKTSDTKSSDTKEISKGKIKEGDKAPDFTLKSQNEKEINLYTILKDKIVVLYFYPKDDTPGCTKEACSFRDSYEIFKDAGAEVIGISSDSIQSHRDFASKYNLPFILLSDPDQNIRKQYGAITLKIPGRVTFVIDKSGIIRLVFSSQINMKEHSKQAIDIINKIKMENKK